MVKENKLYGAIKRYFGDWDKAIKAAKLSDKYRINKKEWNETLINKQLIKLAKAKKVRKLSEIQKLDNSLFCASRRHLGRPKAQEILNSYWGLEVNRDTCFCTKYQYCYNRLEYCELA